MNILNRLKRLETETLGDSGFCTCGGIETRTEILRQDLGFDSDGTKLEGERVPDHCADCRKPINKRRIILQLCDDTTADRFPEEWQASGNH